MSKSTKKSFFNFYTNFSRTLYSLLQPDQQKYQFVVAYSGGLDSQVLLHLLKTHCEHHPSHSLRAMHVHHGLLPQADLWEQQCGGICQEWKIPYQALRAQVATIQGASLEASARTARYEILGKYLQKNEYLLTAHHANDQAETVLLQLLRGAGPKGLAAMPSKTPFAQGWLLRPLLHFSREEIQQYANQQPLSWIDDVSNTDLKFDRNYLRQAIMPRLLQRWPGALKTLARSSELCAQADAVQQALAQKNFLKVFDQATQTLVIHELLKMPNQDRCGVIRFWLEKEQNYLPSYEVLQQIDQTILQAAPDAQPVVHCSHFSLRRFANKLWLVTNNATHAFAEKISKIAQPWILAQPHPLPDGRELHLIPQAMGGIADSYLSHSWSVRFRKGGERLRLSPNGPHQTLKNLLQRWQVPTWKRSQIPLIFIDDQLAIVVGYAISADFIAKIVEPGTGWTVIEKIQQ